MILDKMHFLANGFINEWIIDNIEEFESWNEFKFEFIKSANLFKIRNACDGQLLRIGMASVMNFDRR